VTRSDFFDKMESKQSAQAQHPLLPLGKKGSDPFFEWSTNIGAVVGRVLLWRQFSAA
jgi:hypothetical protein